MKMYPQFAPLSDISMIIYGKFCIRDIWSVLGENGGKIIINKKVAKIGSKFRLKKNVFGFMIMLGTPKQVVSDLKMPKKQDPGVDFNRSLIEMRIIVFFIDFFT